MPASAPPPHLFTYQHYRYCLAIESAWIIVPALLAIFEFSAAEPGAWHRLVLTAVGAGDTAGFSAPAAFTRGLLEVAALSIALTAAAIVPPVTLWMAAKRLAVVGVFGIVLAGQVVRAQQRAQRTLRRAKRA